MSKKIDPYKRRLAIVNNFLSQFSIEFGHNFSAGLCGSMVIGRPGENSDIDMFIIIEPDNLSRAIYTKSFREVFGVNIQDSVKEKFRLGSYDVYRPSDGNIKEVTLSINILSLSCCKRLAMLEKFFVQKFRHTPHFEKLQFRGFGYINGQDTIPFNPIINKEDGGYRHQVISLIRHNGEPYFHIYIDKFFTAQFLIDHLEIETLQNILRVKMYKEFLKTKYQDPYGFLLKRKHASSEQIERLSLGRNS